jgi:predicted GIY-YIG superfamily endonuclease
MTNNPRRRYNQHKRGQAKYTKRFCGNVICVYLEVLEHRDKKTVSSMAWHREKQIKKWSTKRKKDIIRLNQQRSAELIRKFIG